METTTSVAVPGWLGGEVEVGDEKIFFNQQNNQFQDIYDITLPWEEIFRDGMQ